jgi:oxaloacetate decarboxylase beta subunit
MSEPRAVSKKEQLLFPVIGMLLCCFLAPASIPLLGPFFFGNLMRVSGVVERLAQTARTAIIDTATIFLGFTVGASTQADVFLTPKSIGIFVLGSVAFSIATASGVLFAKFMNLFSKEKINPLLGAAGVSAVPGSAREVHLVGQKEDPTNYLLMHAMACNSSGVIGSAICAGILWSFMV